VRFFQAIDNRHDLVLFQTLAFTGIRPGEAANLKGSDIELDGMWVYGKQKRRWVPLPPELRDALLVFGSGPIFYDLQGLKQPRRHIRHIFTKYAERAGIETKKHGGYIFRHSFASYLSEQGVELRVIQELMGHTSPKMTARYANPSNAHVRQIYLEHNPSNLINGGNGHD